MKYILSIFLILIFVTEHFNPITKSNPDSTNKRLDEKNNSLSACEQPPKTTLDNYAINDIWEILINELSWNTFNNKTEVQNEISRINRHGSWYFDYLSAVSYTHLRAHET